ncbi:hypothetical protein TNCV_401921 [Trichonephila clavipes]|nr:hypothetical protein TNCV_401921 [Trichonephila clavipes]
MQAWTGELERTRPAPVSIPSYRLTNNPLTHSHPELVRLGTPDNGTKNYGLKALVLENILVSVESEHCDGSLRDLRTNPLGKSLSYQFVLFTTNLLRRRSGDVLETVAQQPMRAKPFCAQFSIHDLGSYGTSGKIHVSNSVVPARISSQSSRHCWRSPLPHASALIQRDFGCLLAIQQTNQLPHVAKVDLLWQPGM